MNICETQVRFSDLFLDFKSASRLWMQQSHVRKYYSLHQEIPD